MKLKVGLAVPPRVLAGYVGQRVGSLPADLRPSCVAPSINPFVRDRYRTAGDVELFLRRLGKHF